MTSQAFGAFVTVEDSRELPEAPQRALPRHYHSVPHTPDIELDSIQWGTRLNGPAKSGNATTASGTQTPRGINDLEMSRPGTPVDDDGGVNALQSWNNPPMNRFRMLNVCLLNFCNGMSDSAPGALIPYMEKHYSIGYAIVSLLFVTNAVGFISAAFIVDSLRARVGRAKSLMVAQSCMLLGYVAIVCTPPFGVVIAAFFFLGFGMAINLALGNTFAVNLQKGTTMLGAMHGSYGLGGTVGPLIATAMVTSGSLVWSRYYLIPLSFTLTMIGFSGWAFWHYEADAAQPLLSSSDQTASAPQVQNKTGQFADMARAFKSKTVILGALFIFAYQGAEVSISGWVISFLIATRKGDPASVGYVTSGFWAGITLGRFLLSHPAHKIGEKRFVYGMILGAFSFQLIVWFVPNIIGDAVAVSIVGLLLGPIYPCATHIFSRLIPRKDQVISLSIISAFGSSGGAVAPFTTGILAQAAGTFVLHPIALGLFVVMTGCWFSLPKIVKRTE
ncbi:MFS efflux [Phlyctema vagabunda]|uniref:MFS efflux n=1 Tax=Phlyctema vagabunda TaxID=108571 RepID=A0ABR4PVI8_9HELO